MKTSDVRIDAKLNKHAWEQGRAERAVPRARAAVAEAQRGRAEACTRWCARSKSRRLQTGSRRESSPTCSRVPVQMDPLPGGEEGRERKKTVAVEGGGPSGSRRREASGRERSRCRARATRTHHDDDDDGSRIGLRRLRAPPPRRRGRWRGAPVPTPARHRTP